jgi:hypothetical protein
MFRFLSKSKSCNACERPAKPASAPVSKACMEALESRQLMSATLAPTAFGAPIDAAPAADQVMSLKHDGSTPEQAAAKNAPRGRVFRITNVRANANGLGGGSLL